MIFDKSAIQKKYIEDWLIKEFNAKKLPNKSEYSFSCPFCDKNKKHDDYTFNTEKLIGRDWRGFDPRCESGHTLLTFVSLYYDVNIEKASSYIKSKFEIENSMQRVKEKLKSIQSVNYVFDEIEEQKIFWEMPKETVSIFDKSIGAKKAFKWLTEKRKIPIEVIKLLEPKYLRNDVKEARWKKYYNRVFFPVKSNGNEGWLAYSFSKEHQPKTLNPPGPILSNMLFLYDFYKSDKKPILICEGLFDALRLFIFGFNAVAIFGTNISVSQINLLNSTKAEEIVVCLDSDASEFKLDKDGKYSSKALRLARILKRDYFGDVSIMKLEKGDPDDSTFEVIENTFNRRMGLNKLAVKMRHLTKGERKW